MMTAAELMSQSEASSGELLTNERPAHVLMAAGPGQEPPAALIE